MNADKHVLDEIARLTQIDYAREMAFIAAFEGEADTLGVVRAVTDPDNVEAEFAIIVRSDLHHGGLGRLLLDKILRYCRAEGTQRLVGLVLPENRTMIELAREAGFSIDTVRSDRDGIRLARTLNPDTTVPPATAAGAGPAPAVPAGAESATPWSPSAADAPQATSPLAMPPVSATPSPAAFESAQTRPGPSA